MRCSVYNCVNNSGGYCYDKDFVSINDQGKCNLMHLRPDTKPEKMEDNNGGS